VNPNPNEIEVKNNAAEERYEVALDGLLAFLEYERTGDRIVLIHTEVPDALEGHGIASKIARTALDDARAQHLSVVPMCTYVRSYIKRHPEYEDLVAPEFKERMLGE
jgi:uncharacterized protein